MSVSKRTRFEVFKRDGFRCVYCGATPADGPLHVDHVDPKAGGGTDEVGNLVTACASCNLGKSDVPLGRRLPAREVTEEQREQAEQIEEYLKIQREIRAAQDKLIQAVSDHWAEQLGAVPKVSDRYFRAALKTFSVSELLDAIDITAGRFGSYGDMGYDKLTSREWEGYEQAIRYWHGILRRWRNERGPK